MLKVEPKLQVYEALVVAGLKFPQNNIFSDSLCDKPEDEQL